jgi:hypothetical protein
MTNEELAKEIIDILTNNSENPGRMVQHLAEDCTWAINPGDMMYRGLPEIKKFIDIAMASRSSKKNQPTKVAVHDWFVDNDHLCIEYGHTFSFGMGVPGLAKKASNSTMEHCNIYTMTNGKIVSIHEYASSSFWWLNLAAQIMLKRIWKKTKHQMR